MTIWMQLRTRHLDLLLATPAVLAAAAMILYDLRLVYVLAVLMIAVACTMVGRRWPGIPFYFLLITLMGDQVPSEFFDLEIRVSGLALTPADAAYALMLSIMAINVFQRPRIALTYWQVFPGGVLLLLYSAALIAAGVSAYGHSSIAEFRYMYSGLIVPFFAVSLGLDRQTWMKILRRSLWICAVLTTVLAILAAGLGGARPFSPSDRFLGSSAHVWMSVCFMLMAVPGLIRVSTMRTAWAWAACAPMVFLILSDGHRSAWLTLLVMAAVVFLLGRGEFRGFRRLALIGMLLILPIFALLLLIGGDGATGFFAERAQAFLAPQEDGTSAWRLWVWRAAWEVFGQHPVFGIGLGNYFSDVWSILVIDDPSRANADYVGASLHNFYMILLVKGGLVFAALYAWYVWNMAWIPFTAYLRFPPADRIYATLGLALIAGMLVFQVAYNLADVLILYIGMIIGYLRAVEHEAEPRQQRDVAPVAAPGVPA